MTKTTFSLKSTNVIEVTGVEDVDELDFEAEDKGQRELQIGSLGVPWAFVNKARVGTFSVCQTSL